VAVGDVYDSAVVTGHGSAWPVMCCPSVAGASLVYPGGIMKPWQAG
jgi:hypothetical protein